MTTRDRATTVPGLVPQPASLTPRPGRFTIPAVLDLKPGPGAERAADLLASYLYLGTTRSRSQDGPSIHLELRPLTGGKLPGSVNAEAYALDIDVGHVTLTAPHEAGLFHGVQTLRQLLPADAFEPDASAEDWSWPCLTIRDAPRLPWRGALLDVARHFMPLSFLYRFVDLLALHKLNVLHLHLTDDQGWRIEIQGLPLLTDVGSWRSESMIGPAGSAKFDGTPHGGHYTQAQLKALVRYADARGVRVVPEIDMPGHARAALAAYPYLGNHPERRLSVWTSWGICEDIFGVHDAALEFCRTVLGQTMDVFPDRYVHIGGDECPTTQWTTNPAALRRTAELGLDSPAELHGWFLRQMADFLTANGRRCVCWDETGHHPDGQLPREIALTAWRDPGHGIQAIRRGHQVIMAPHLSTYFDYPQRDHPDEPLGHPNAITTLEDVYRFDPLVGGLPVADPQDGLRPGVLGTQAQLWTEFAATPEHVEYLAFPRLCALAEVAWSEPAPRTGRPHGRDYAGFAARLAEHVKLLRRLGVRVPNRPAASHTAADNTAAIPDDSPAADDRSKAGTMGT
jgi:hexosaminidase